MATELTDAIVTTIGDAARQLRGQAKRAFQARVAMDYLHGSARRAETCPRIARYGACSIVSGFAYGASRRPSR